MGGEEFSLEGADGERVVILEKLCQSNGFMFINNINITEMDLAGGSDLKESGKCILANNNQQWIK